MARHTALKTHKVQAMIKSVMPAEHVIFIAATCCFWPKEQKFAAMKEVPLLKN
jgi:hypothetical protein